MQIKPKVICVTGLPRSGSTLLCQLLGLHPDIYSTAHSSPLCSTLNQLRHQLSDNELLLSQLDCDFELGYQRLINVHRSVINGWFAETDCPWVVDKNRGWLMQLDTVSALIPDFRMLVCVREPTQVYGSIEAQHQKTVLLDFPDHLAPLSRYARADKLFANDGVIGGPLKAIEALQDIPENLQKRLFYVVFEHLVQEPQTVLSAIHEWLHLPTHSLDSTQLPVRQHESDSYYRFKYPHQTRSTITPPQQHPVSQRIKAEIQQQFQEIYRLFYAGTAENNNESNQSSQPSNKTKVT